LRIGYGLKRGFAGHLIELRRTAVLPAILSAVFLSSCTSTSSNLEAGTAALTTPPPQIEEAVTDESGQDIGSQLPPGGVKPSAKPGAVQVAGAPAVSLILAGDQPPQVAQTTADPSKVAQLAVASAAQENNAAPVAVASAEAPQNPADVKLETGTVAATASADGAITALAAEETPAEGEPAVKKRKSFFGSMFSNTKDPKPQPLKQAAPAQTQLALAAPEAKKDEAEFALANLDKPLEAKVTKSVISDADAVDNGALPGVRQSALFEIKHRNNASDDSNIDISEEDSAPVQVAYAAGLARLAPNGLKVQRESVDVACLKPQLVKVLKGVERHYGRDAIVTSGFRSPSFNRRVRGAKHSLHMFCAAADIQVPGVSKWALAKYLRSLPGRGGVGTYCHTDSIHVDIGPDRDWNWRCSRRRR
jgi:uncharacterized protein YcbK (DUF882 family)